MQLLEFARRNLMECQKSIENITKLDKNFNQLLLILTYYQT